MLNYVSTVSTKIGSVSTVLDQNAACLDCARPCSTQKMCSTCLTQARYVSTARSKNMCSTDFGYVSTFKQHELSNLKRYKLCFWVTSYDAFLSERNNLSYLQFKCFEMNYFSAKFFHFLKYWFAV